MKPMGILTQPFRRVSLSSRLLKLSRIQLFMSLAKVFSHQRIDRLVITNIGKRMPSPVTERTQWDALTVSLRKSLQTSSVYRHGEVTIANGESRQSVQCINMRIIARHHFMTVNNDITCQSVCSKRWSKRSKTMRGTTICFKALIIYC